MLNSTILEYFWKDENVENSIWKGIQIKNSLIDS